MQRIGSLHRQASLPGMAVIQINYRSTALAKMCALWITAPDEWAGEPLPVLYLLHGLSDDNSAWLRRTSVERYADQHRMLVAMPDGDRSWYTNAVQPEQNRYEDHILEVVDRVDALFQTRTERGGRGIGGLSMGGYGAVKIGLRHAERFGSIHSHSGALDVTAAGDRWGEEKALIFGDEPAPRESCFHLAEGADPRPALHIDCGIDDFLIDHNRRFHAHLEAIGYEHAYLEHPGAHNWAYWDQHIVAALAFHARCFAG